jgi:hypothetical protein
MDCTNSIGSRADLAADEAGPDVIWDGFEPSNDKLQRIQESDNRNAWIVQKSVLETFSEVGMGKEYA